MAEKAKREYNISEEDRERRSELAKRLHKEKKFGGKQKGAGRPKKRRAQEVVAEKIAEDGTKIYKALNYALKSESPSIKLKAALAMLDIESRETELKIQEEQRMYDNLSKTKLLELIQQRLQRLGEAGTTIPGIEIDGFSEEELVGGRVAEDVIATGRAFSAGDS